MAVKHAVVEVGTTAVSLFDGITDKGYKPTSTMIVQNNGSESVFVGDDEVTTSDYGLKITPGTVVVLDLTRGDLPFAIAGSPQTVNVLYLGVDA
jgi:hypothetical protein